MQSNTDQVHLLKEFPKQKVLGMFCRFFCSELVAQMLVQAGQVKLKRNLDFLANGRTDGQLLNAPVIAMCPTPEVADKRLKLEKPAT